jgi:hypothetical protein
MGRWLIILGLAVLGAACSAPSPDAATTMVTEPQSRDRAWEGRAFDLFGLVRLEATTPDGAVGRATVFDDGVELGAGNRLAWADDAMPEPIAEMMAAADCPELGFLLDRWSDVLYRLDVSRAEKAEADAFLRFGMGRSDELGCGYVVEREGRATPFP